MDLILATVTQVSPLRVRLDGAATSSDATKISMFTAAVNQRVVTSQQGSTIYVHGPLAAGDAAAGATSSQMATLRANTVLSGGGIIVMNSDYVRWTNRFIAMAIGRGLHYADNGYFDLVSPPAGTSIPGYGGAATSSVGADGMIYLNAWHALWAIPTIGGSNVTYARTFYTSTFVVPDHWIFVALRNGDDGRVRWGNGEIHDYWRSGSYVNGWVSYGSDYPPARYRKDTTGKVEIQAMMSNGTMGQPAFVLPAGYRPGKRLLYNNESNAGSGRGDITTIGEVIPINGGNGWYSFMPAPFAAEL